MIVHSGMNRWHVIPRNKFFNIYLHEIHRSDAGPYLHDHPWHSLSLMMKGDLIEVRPARGYHVDEFTHADEFRTEMFDRTEGELIFRRPADLHRLILKPDAPPVYTLFITGPYLRTWGFQTERGWVPYWEFPKADTR